MVQDGSKGPMAGESVLSSVPLGPPNKPQGGLSSQINALTQAEEFIALAPTFTSGPFQEMYNCLLSFRAMLSGKLTLQQILH